MPHFDRGKHEDNNFEADVRMQCASNHSNTTRIHSVKRTTSCDVDTPNAKKQCTAAISLDCTDIRHLKRSLSLDDGVPGVKRQRAIVTAFDQMVEIYKRSDSMDNIFKINYIHCVFSTLTQIERDWRNQVNNIVNIWERGVNLIIHELLLSLFWIECEELSLPAESYDFERAYRLAETEWRIELMLAVVQMIIKWYDDDVHQEATGFVVWDVAKQEIVVDRTVCNKL